MFFYVATLFLHVAQCAVTTALPGPGCNAHLLSGQEQFASLRVKHFSSKDVVTRHPFIRSSKAIEPWYFQQRVSQSGSPGLTRKLLHQGLLLLQMMIMTGVQSMKKGVSKSGLVLLQGMIMIGVKSMKKGWNACHANGIAGVLF
jgi:hypothetical protein